METSVCRRDGRHSRGALFRTKGAPRPFNLLVIRTSLLWCLTTKSLIFGLALSCRSVCVPPLGACRDFLSRVVLGRHTVFGATLRRPRKTCPTPSVVFVASPFWTHLRFLHWVRCTPPPTRIHCWSSDPTIFMVDVEHLPSGPLVLLRIRSYASVETDDLA
jgi:hypothetical protein